MFPGCGLTHGFSQAPCTLGTRRLQRSQGSCTVGGIRAQIIAHRDPWGLLYPAPGFLRWARRFLLFCTSLGHPSGITTCSVVAYVLKGLGTGLCPSACLTGRVNLLLSLHGIQHHCTIQFTAWGIFLRT